MAKVFCVVIFLQVILCSGTYNYFYLFPLNTCKKQEITHIMSDKIKIEGGDEYFVLKRDEK